MGSRRPGNNHARVRGARRTRYRRSTPVIRLQRNVEKIVYLISLGLTRLRDWQESATRRSATRGSATRGTAPRATGSEVVERALAVASEVAEKSVELDDLVSNLEASGFVPPKRSTAYQPEVGDHVQICDQSRPRYRQLYDRQLREDPKMLDDLVVVKTLPSGEVAVQRGRRTPLVARKSHLCPVKEDA
jgi:hypothetical protein